MVQRETHPANRPPAPFDPLQPEVQLRGRKMKKEKREIKRKREREKKHGINGIKKKRGQKREREEEKKRKRSRWTPDIERGCRVGSVRRVIDIRIFGRTAIFSLLVLFFFFFFPSLFFYSSPRWRPSPPTKPPANPLWCTANIRRLSLVSPPQFVFSLATPFDQYFNFAMLRYLAGPKRTGRADARERSVVLPRGGITM